jgi:Family of unknown function (DUF6941)
MPPEQQPPEVLALLIADHVHRDEESGKLFLLGTRNSVGAREFPWTQARLAVYAALTDGRGETRLELRLVDVEESREPVLAHEVGVNFEDPTEDLEVVFLLNDIVFPEPGDYRL